MEAASVSAEVSWLRHGSQVEGRKPYGWGSPDRKTIPSCRGGRQRRAWQGGLDPWGRTVIVIGSGVNCIGSRGVAVWIAEGVRVVHLRRAVSLILQSAAVRVRQRS